MLIVGARIDHENEENGRMEQDYDAVKSGRQLASGTGGSLFHEDSSHEAVIREIVDLTDSPPNVPSTVEWYSFPLPRT